MLKDSYNRRFDYLRLSVTEVCNFKCNYCLPDGYQCDTRPHPLSLDEIQTLVSAFASAGTRKIRITGGEPTLRKDLAQIVQICADTPQIETVAMTTNAYRLTKQLSQLVDAGLTALNISADSLNPYTFAQITGRDSLDEIFASIDLALELGLKTVKLNAVLLKQYNARELNSFLNFIQDKPVSFRFIELMRTGDNHAYFDAQHVSGMELQSQLICDGWQLQPKADYAGPAVEFAHPDYLGKIGLIMPYAKDFCASCNRLRVSAEGKLHLCLFGEANDDLRPWLQNQDVDGLQQHLQQAVLGKWKGHQLHQQNSGLTKQLAMLGG